jgi:S-adenosylmethionine/arginine decarboxylase-like enzyme
MLHVTVDLYRCRSELLSDETFLRQTLSDLPDRIGMRKVSSVELCYIGVPTFLPPKIPAKDLWG